jgi:hypothetical protein
MSFHSDTLITILSKQVFAFTHLSCILSGEATNTNIIYLCFTRLGLEPTIYCTQGKRAIHININAVLWFERYMVQLTYE